MRQALSAFILLSATCVSGYGQDSLSHLSGYSHIIHFRLDKSDIDRTYLNNRYVLSTLDELFSSPVRVLSIDSMHIYSYASPEGSEVHNIRLARRRSDAMKRYLTGNYPLLPHARISYFPCGENWDGLKELVQHGSFEEREEVLMILDAVKDPARREELLKRLNAGHAYRYLSAHVLPLLRNAMACTIWYNPRLTSVEDAPPAPLLLSSGTDAPVPFRPLSNLPEPRKNTTVSRAERATRYSALKTNLACWGMTAVSLAYETQTGRRFSLDLPLMWSSWDVTRRHALRVIALQPELRYWLSQPGRGHFFGLHAHIARYNLKWNDVRYQDTGRPLLGAGLSYGYLLPFNERWGMEFTLGAGYADTRYNLYHNTRPTSKGQLFDVRTLRYWGVTRIGLSFIYKLPQR